MSRSTRSNVEDLDLDVEDHVLDLEDLGVLDFEYVVPDVEDEDFDEFLGVEFDVKDLVLDLGDLILHVGHRCRGPRHRPRGH